MKKKVVLILVVVLIILGVLLGMFFLSSSNRKAINKIKDSYHNVVITTDEKDVFIYKDGSYQKKGIVGKDVVLSLMKPNIKNRNDKYFKIENSDYYIDYLDIEEKKDYYEDKSIDHYVSTKTIKTIPTKLYKDGDLVISLDVEMEFDVLLVDYENYYVKFLGGVYYIKDSYELLDKQLDKELLGDISVLSFSDDISDDKFKETLGYLKDNSYETITIDDFKLWISGKVNIYKDKVLLLSYKELSTEKKVILEEYNYLVEIDHGSVSFVSGDTKLKIKDEKYYKYDINSNTSLDRVKDMLKGIKEVKQVDPVKTNKQGVAVLNYHFFYDSSNGEGCNESICLDTSNFRKQLDYLRDNGYRTLRMSEFNDWMDGKITLPKKSVLITIDDGAMGTNTHLPKILDEYKMYGTLFLITGWWDKSNYKSEYLEIQSHGDELHHSNYCDGNGCGYKTKKLSKDLLVSDLKLSIDKIGTNLAFCYPFYVTSNNLVTALKETGFKVAFVGGNKKAYQTTNKYYVPRYVVYKNTSLNSFIKMVSQ